MRLFKDLINCFFFVLGHLFLRARRKIVFGAWHGNSYSDNPKFFFEFLFEHPEFRIVWIGNKSVRATLPPLPPHASFAVRHSPLGLWHALTAKTWVFSHSTNDISLVAVWGRSLLFDTSHGVSLKNVGNKCPSWKPAKTSWVGRLIQPRFYLVTPSAWQSKCTLEGYPNLFRSPALPFGSTTLDFILSKKDDSLLRAELRSKFATVFNIPIDKKWIVYVPTFRWLKDNNFSFRNISQLERTQLVATLNKLNAVILEKTHPDVISWENQKGDNTVIPLSGPKAKLIEPHELWLAADGVISDYSGSVIPFFLLGKPIVHFVYDYVYYTTKDTGLVADLEDIRFGAIARNLDELLDCLAHLDRAANQCGKRARELIEYEDGKACEKYLAFIRKRQGLP